MPITIAHRVGAASAASEEASPVGAGSSWACATAGARPAKRTTQSNNNGRGCAGEARRVGSGRCGGQLIATTHEVNRAPSWLTRLRRCLPTGGGLWAIAALVLGATPQDAQATGRALLIGASNAPEIQPLSAVDNDVKTMESLLVEDYSFPRGAVQTLSGSGVSRQAVMSAFGQPD